MLGVTRSKAKMYEYSIQEEYHIGIREDPAKLFTISIGMLGDYSATINRGGNNPELHSELQDNLRFAAYFFDAYLRSKLNNSLDPYLILLGSASYYLCNLPGSAAVLVKWLSEDYPELNSSGLDSMLLELLRSNLQGEINVEEEYIELALAIKNSFSEFMNTGTGEQQIIELANNLRKSVYDKGSPRELLLGDIITALFRKKIENSTWVSLPLYSGISRQNWTSVLSKASFIKELWPAQHLLGRHDVYKGKSAIVQMPTSAGKTKATELILRSGFISQRITFAAIVAPFKALCHEIRNDLVDAFKGEEVYVDELTDSLQTDFDLSELLDRKQIIVVTPEKLLYILRHNSELATSIGLIVFDEGHQFDSGTRGITYELLLTSLRSLLPDETQKVLISAVIKNAEDVGTWLNGEANVVHGSNLTPTIRSIGFASWVDQLGRIEYVDGENPEQREFFVPRVIERFFLGKKAREKKDRYFPEKDDGNSIALYLGLKLIPSGSVAVFCGRKSTAVKICEKVVDIIERGVPLPLPIEISEQNEVSRLHVLHAKNLGSKAPVTQSAQYGIFSHHGSTPQGIRLAVEYAMRNGDIKFVVCTSTLAQGVNLPIRYLIVTSVYQGGERIKVRDFHNLIGRAGRAGMHTEGSILFADRNIYDKKNNTRENWRWRQVKELLEPTNSEPCISNLLSIFEKIQSDDERYNITVDPLELVELYINDRNDWLSIAETIADQHGDKNFTQKGVERQLFWKVNLISAIESFLLAHWDETEGGLADEDIQSLAEGTLAFYLANDEQKVQIQKLFLILGKNIRKVLPEPERRKLFGRTLYGVQDTLSIEKWVNEKSSEISEIQTVEQLLELSWPFVAEHIHANIFKKIDKPEFLIQIAQMWIEGASFGNILEFINQNDIKRIWGNNRRKIKIGNVVDLCEGALAFEGALVIGAIFEFVSSFNSEEYVNVLDLLLVLQKRFNYGLPSKSSIAVYELGFSDRVISQEMTNELSIASIDRRALIQELSSKGREAIRVISDFPSYYQDRLSRLI